MPSTLPLFVYGTLRDAEIRRGVLGRELDEALIAPALARGWRAVYFGAALYPALVSHADHGVPGLVLWGLGVDDRKRLDRFEGDEYRLGRIAVDSCGADVEALAYLPSSDIGTEAMDWTFEHWARNHRPHVMARYRASGFAGD